MGGSPENCLNCKKPGKLERVFAGQTFSAITHSSGAREMFVRTGKHEAVTAIPVTIDIKNQRLKVERPVRIMTDVVQKVGSCN